MRPPILLLAILLASAAWTFVPTADAAGVCVARATGCGGLACVEQDSDGRWTDDECVSKADLDPCHMQTDCCSATSGFWCPEKS